MSKFIQPLYIAGIIGGIYSGGFIFGYNYHSNIVGKDAAAVSDDSSESRPYSTNPRIYEFGLPTPDPTLNYANHVVGFDPVRRIPRWVAQTITEEDLSGSANRKRSNFAPDHNLPELFRATNSDFRGSSDDGLSRGHMASAGDNKASQEAMDQTFLLSNILPQNYENNAGFWNRLEMFCRDLTKNWKEVHVVSGPVMRPTVELDPMTKEEKRFVKYQVIGDKEVAVPSHLYKVILCRGRKSAGNSNDTSQEADLALGAFLTPNEPIPWSKELVDFQISLEEAQRVAGLQFFPKLQRDLAVDLCRTNSCQLIRYNEFQLYLVGRQLKNAETKEQIVAAWKKLDRKNLQPDQYLIDLLREKVNGLNLSREELDADDILGAAATAAAGA